MDEQTCKEIFLQTDEHVKHAKAQAKEQREHATSSEPNDHQGIFTLGHGGVKPLYTKRTSITQQHYNSTCTPILA